MVENTKIEWADHTFNPFVGCQKVSPACDHCYAEGWAKRTGQEQLWAGDRRRTTAANWQKPLKWNREAEAHGRPVRVFCASLADVFDNQVPVEWRSDLWDLIHETPNLIWMLLTKRPQNIPKMLPAHWGGGWSNVWLGTTVENQEEAVRRIPHLLSVNARRRFLSCEPLLGPVNLRCVGPNQWDVLDDGWDEAVTSLPTIDLVIVGGESGHGARPMDPAWARSLRDQCRDAGVQFFMKQMGGPVKARMPEIPGDLMVREFP